MSMFSVPVQYSASSSSSSSSRSPSSFLSASSSSSRSSTFSDLSISSVNTDPSPPPSTSGARTHAFFASPFSMQPPSPSPPPRIEIHDDTRWVHHDAVDKKPSSITADFFATPVRLPSPPIPPKQPHGHSIQTRLSAIHPSRIFPSRYTREPSLDPVANKHIPEFLTLDLDVPNSNFSLISDRNADFLASHGYPYQHDRALSSSSSISSSSSTSSLYLPVHTPTHRLPTPPPPIQKPVEDTHDEPTPRPPSLQPSPSKLRFGAEFGAEDESTHQPEQVDPSPGTIITSHPSSISPGSSTTPSPISATFSFNNNNSPSSSPSPTAVFQIQTPQQTIVRLLRPLGQGAFSAVWLADDLSVIPLTLASKESVRDLRRAASLKKGVGNVTGAGEEALSRNSSLKKFKERVRGTRPPFRLGRVYLDERHGEMGIGEDPHVGITELGEKVSSDGEHDRLGASLSRASSTKSQRQRGRLVAVKMTPRKNGSYERGWEEEEERTRVGFVREVEILRHISHPNITPLLSSLSTPTHHILVLPYLPGGDLLGLVNNDIAWGRLSESVLKRIWSELCRAVGWMHGVGLVHRDIKLENILLTTSTFHTLTLTSPVPTFADLPASPLPLIKLTDFGLSRFIEIGADGEGELLSTRCGSEAYAAPELVMGSSSNNNSSRTNRSVNGNGVAKGFYDPRETDAWACGVVLYALVGRRLPFGEGVRGVASPIGGERAGGAGFGRVTERRQWLMRIAKGEWEWPGSEDKGNMDVGGELVGERLTECWGARRVVERLLVRDPRKRARIGELWNEEWMREGDGESGSGELVCGIRGLAELRSSAGPGVREGISTTPEWEERECMDDMKFDAEGGEGETGLEEEEDADADGWLFDQDGIDSIARREVV